MNPESKLPAHADIVIIGGGIMGTSTAFFLASNSDKDIVLLEKDNIASGSTGDSSAILRHHYTGNGKEIYSKMAWWSHKFYRNFENKTDHQIAHTENPRVRFGKDNTQQGRMIREGYKVLKELDIPTTKYKDELSNEYPMFADLDQFDFAISDDTAGYSDGYDAANGFALASENRGVTVRTGVSATDIHIENDKIADVETDGGSVGCETVVLAAGPWNSRLADCVGVELPITPTREQIIILDPDDEYKEKHLAEMPTARIFGGDWYMRPDFGDGVLVATHYGTEKCDPDTYNSLPDEDKILEATDLLFETIPELDDAKIKGQYCGVYSMTPDRDFIIDQAGPDGCYLLAGFSGHGFKHGPAAGKVMSDLILKDETDFIDVDFFSLDRFEDHPNGHGRPEENL